MWEGEGHMRLLEFPVFSLRVFQRGCIKPGRQRNWLLTFVSINTQRSGRHTEGSRCYRSRPSQGRKSTLCDSFEFFNWGWWVEALVRRLLPVCICEACVCVCLSVFTCRIIFETLNIIRCLQETMINRMNNDRRVKTNGRYLVFAHSNLHLFISSAVPWKSHRVCV